MQSEFGIIGLGVMGRNLALNLAGRQVRLSVYNRHIAGIEENIAGHLLASVPDTYDMQGFDDLAAFVDSLERPRKIMLMITAGTAVDEQIGQLLLLLEEGDIVLDGGNSYYKDTFRRAELLRSRGIHYIGTGISGGEEGALKGPAIMPGGAKEGYDKIAPYLQKIAARDRKGNPCTTYIGPDGAGHFVKMVHNGIEYAEMQLWAETYALLKNFLCLENVEISGILNEWQKGSLKSYLLEITIDILNYKEGDGLLLDYILDQAEQKGTGWLSTATALEYGVPYDTLSLAVMARNLSAGRKDRLEGADLYQYQSGKYKGNKETFIHSLEKACQTIRYINHAHGFDLIRKASETHSWNINLSELARIWTNGCIIRSSLMEELIGLFREGDNLLLIPGVAERLSVWRRDLAFVVTEGLRGDIALPVYSGGLNYLLGRITASSPANLIQAQRDYFGAHTYKRIDGDPEQRFHTNWASH